MEFQKPLRRNLITQHERHTTQLQPRSTGSIRCLRLREPIGLWSTIFKGIVAQLGRYSQLLPRCLTGEAAAQRINEYDFSISLAFTEWKNSLYRLLTWLMRFQMTCSCSYLRRYAKPYNRRYLDGAVIASYFCHQTNRSALWIYHTDYLISLNI